MPRKHKNARRKPWRRRTRAKPDYMAKIIKVTRKQDDKMSPGRLMAIAEWRKIS